MSLTITKLLATRPTAFLRDAERTVFDPQGTARFVRSDEQPFGGEDLPPAWSNLSVDLGDGWFFAVLTPYESVEEYERHQRGLRYLPPGARPPSCFDRVVRYRAAE